MRLIEFDFKIPKNAWAKHIKNMINLMEDITSYRYTKPCVYIESISRNGAFLEMDYSAPEEISDIIEAIYISTKEKLKSICVCCGKDKGQPPSTTVHPAMCEECRKSLTPESFKNDVIICMSGKAGSGKDTVADYLVKNHDFKRMAFADPLRDIVQLVFVMDKENVWDRKLRELPLKDFPNHATNDIVKWYYNEGFINFPNITKDELSVLKESYNWTGDMITSMSRDEMYWSVRKLLQFIGTEMFRNLINRDIWVKNFISRIEPGTNYVVTDARFINEIECIKKHFGGKIMFIEVKRQGCDGVSVGIKNHESERYSLPSDVILENNGTIEELYCKVEDFLKDISKQ